MKKKIITIVLGVFLLVFTATTVYASTLLNISLDGTYNYDKCNEVFDLVNSERSKAQVSSLQLDYELTKKAQIRAREAALYFSHTRPNGDDALSSLGANGENIAAGSSTASGVMNQWMTSSGHKANILNKSFKSIGIGSFTTKSGATYWVQVFSTKKATITKKFSGSSDKNGEIVNIKTGLIKSISISDSKNKKLNIGEEYTISSARIENAGWSKVYTPVNNKNFTWKSSNNKIATVDSNGTIKGLDNGEVTITATLAGKKATYDVTVGTKQVDVESLKFTNESATIYVGEEKTFTPKISPSSASNSKLTWKSSNTSVATVDQSGKVKGLTSGKTTITVTAPNNKKASIELTVSEKLIKKITLSKTFDTINVGESKTLTATIEPTDAVEKITWKSSNTKIATVENGKVKGLSAGKVKITASSKNDSASITIEVVAKQTSSNEQNNNQSKEIPITGVKLNCDEININIGQSFQMQYTIYPENATEKPNPTWLGFNGFVADLTSTGKVTGLSQGEGYISVIVGKNNVKASCKVRIIAQDELKRLYFSFLPTRLTPDQAYVLEVHHDPPTSKVYGSLKWTSSDPSIISVRDDGIIFTHRAGTATITVTAPNGVTTSTTLTVKTSW